MGKVAKALTALEVRRLDTPGLHAVGTVPGLYLRVLPAPSMAKSWILRAVVGEKRRDLGLAWQWGNSLELYAFLKIGQLDVADIGMSQVLEVLEPIWRTKTETASRVRGRIELILAWADKRAERERLNPARWRGHLDTQLPAPTKVSKPKHHAALPVGEAPSFMQRLRKQEGSAGRALEFATLTAARSRPISGYW